MLDPVAHYRYGAFAEALSEAGLDTSLRDDWPSDPADRFLLFHTMAVNHEPVRAIQQRYGKAAAAQSIPVQTALAGALHSVLIAGAPAAVTHEGYGLWLNGEAQRGLTSGLVIPKTLAEKAGLAVLELYNNAAVIDMTAPLPRLLARALLAAGGTGEPSLSR